MFAVARVQMSSSVRAGEGADQGFQLHRNDNVPSFLQFNAFVLNGYRPPQQTIAGCVWSSFTSVHNETGNISVHLFVACYMIFLLCTRDYSKHMLLGFVLASVTTSTLTMLGSTAYHLFMPLCTSIRAVRRHCWRPTQFTLLFPPLTLAPM